MNVMCKNTLPHLTIKYLILKFAGLLIMPLSNMKRPPAESMIK